MYQFIIRTRTTPLSLIQPFTAATLLKLPNQSRYIFHPVFPLLPYPTMPFKPASTGLYFEIVRITATETTSRDFLRSVDIIHASVTCSSCHNPMVLTPCAASKSQDLEIWRCRPCRTTVNIWSDSVLENANLPFQFFVLLLYSFASKNLTNVDIAEDLGLSEKCVGNWRAVLNEKIEKFILQNSRAIGGPGHIVEIDEAKFGKRKWDVGYWRDRRWVLGGVDRTTGMCFLLPCENNSRSAATLLPLIQRWVLPGSIVYTDEWSGYNSLQASGFSHDTVNHSIQFVNPTTGVHTNTVEGMWHHVKRQSRDGCQLDDVLMNYMFRCYHFATAGTNQIERVFNGFIRILRV